MTSLTYDFNTVEAKRLHRICNFDLGQNTPLNSFDQTVKIRQLELELNSRSLKYGGLLLEVAVGLICQWIQAHGRSGMNKCCWER